MSGIWAYFTPIYIGIALFVCALVLLYRYFTHVYGYFDVLGIPYPKPFPLLGTVRDIQRLGGLHIALIQYMKDYGHLYGMFVFQEPVIVCSEPDKLKQILVKNFSKFRNRRTPEDGFIGLTGKGLLMLKDDDWKRVRSTLSPTFTSGKMKHMFPVLEGVAKSLIEVIDKYCEDGVVTNVNRMYENYTMDVIAATAFGIQLDAQNTPNEPFVVNCRKVFQYSAENIFVIAFPILQKFMLKKKKWEGMQEFWRDALDKVYRSRVDGTSVVKRKDLLSLMIEASKAEQAMEENKGKKSGMSEEEIKSNIFTFLLAGYETTSNALAYATYLLALNPEKQEKLFDNIKDNLGQQEPNYDNINEIPYLEWVIKEALRLYPPGFRFARLCTETCYIDNLKISKGVNVMVPIYAMHRSSEFFEDPEAFIPERFSPENEHNIKPYTYMPFGEGPRSCIGMRFAMLEAKLALVLIVLKYKYVRTEKTQVPLEMTGGITLTAKDGIFVQFEKR